ncbi:MAG: hypothetical protein KA099_11125 [Alphaproteobacteria bacterium]|nr:hypothetical protein [Alphaproteobacteria bacterium]MBP7757791.1 hypothetical protein [Alphaproteobacteria bacterium]MBP7761009.1 hypothetical protein [Alphaproteobacteria bacterium]MBP7905869.1 hypothetical protein [Alphaproteobacteria bacterium]
MAGAVLKYIDDVADLIKGAKGADEVIKYRRVLNEMNAELAEVITRGGDSQAVDRFIREAIESGDEVKATLFRMPEVQNSLRLSRSRALFKADFDQARTAQRPVNIEELRVKHGLEARDGEFLAAKVTLEQGGLSTRQRYMMEHQHTFDFAAKNYARLRELSDNAGVMKVPLWLTAQGFRFATSSVGLITTVAGTGYLAHAASGGWTTEKVAEATYASLEASARAVKDISPELADALMKAAPGAADLALAFVQAPIEMAEIYVKEGNRRYNWGWDERKIGMTSQALSGHWVGVALASQNINLDPREITRIMGEAQSKPQGQRTDFIVGEVSRISGRSREDIHKFIGQKPQVIDTTGMTPQQVAELERTNGAGQNGTLPGAAAVAATPGVIDRARAALGRRTEVLRDAVHGTVDQASEVVRIGRLSGSGLVAEFNKVADEKGLSWFSSPQMFMIKLMDSIGFDFFGLNNMLKKQVLLDNVKTQFGDQFGVLARNGQNLNLDNTAPAPSSG